MSIRPFFGTSARCLMVLQTLLSGGVVMGNTIPFTLRVIARTGDVIDGHTIIYLGSPAINNVGSIVFTANLSDVSIPRCLQAATALCTSAILTPTRLLVKTGDAIGGQTLTAIRDPISLNDAGAVAFAAGTVSLDNGAVFGQHGIFTLNQLIAKPGDLIDGCTISQIGQSGTVALDPRPEIDNLGSVIFSAMFFFCPGGSTFGSGLFNQYHAVKKTGDTINGKGVFDVSYFGVSSGGVIGFLMTGPNPTFGYYTPSNAILTQAAVLDGYRIDGHRLDGYGPPSINDSGIIAFAGQFDCSPMGCLNAVATQFHAIASANDEIGGVHVSEFDLPFVNNNGAIAFRALVAPNNNTFLLYSTQLGLIAKPGDVIDSKVLQSVGRPVLASYFSVNNEGEVVFLGTFTDGSQEIILATPILDTTPPEVTPTVNGTLGNNGWYRSSANVSWTISDPESGIASSSGCSTTNLLADTAGITLTCSATNGVGLTSSVSITTKIDKTPPVISGMPGQGCTIWPPNHKLVQVAVVSAADALSGLAPDSFRVTGISGSGNSGDIAISGGVVQVRADKGNVYTISASARDIAGNLATATATCTVPHDQSQ